MPAGYKYRADAHIENLDRRAFDFLGRLDGLVDQGFRFAAIRGEQIHLR